MAAFMASVGANASPRSLINPGQRRHLGLEILALIVFWAIGGVLNILPPQKRTFNVNDITLQNPMREQTVPEWLAFILVVVVPFIFIFLIGRSRAGRPVLGLLVSTGLALLVTGALKNLVGGLRPDFLDRCKPNPKDLTQCTGEVSIVNEGRRSFPSGHSSVSAAGLVYTSLYLASFMRVFDANWDEAKGGRIFLSFLPATGAAAIALTRIVDNRHHWLDVFTGFILGAFCAYLCARLYIPGFAQQASVSAMLRHALYGDNASVEADGTGLLAQLREEMRVIAAESVEASRNGPPHVVYVVNENMVQKLLAEGHLGTLVADDTNGRPTPLGGTGVRPAEHVVGTYPMAPASLDPLSSAPTNYATPPLRNGSVSQLPLLAPTR
ncbi:hypothetical protein AMAG_00028 [Allomyces macrogynus ATCC 38327]|uniref:Phosphatidic acid phosphatase type 2/haloperoxidase domain-containing protein n=1 Tax=Allomyces macrogynus (strain ATCC 38327) TaxID=578462 RepID=A0A0L0RUU4_ALLM3|nr:hypothetical protein AMAG_00028 [Allomyces macrogynus ATCC 38327]|eukprot:KNE54028.1 hypothetical protein AMAG_00028 [Allomyces macrogynus ATCC 38327]